MHGLWDGFSQGTKCHEFRDVFRMHYVILICFAEVAIYSPYPYFFSVRCSRVPAAAAAAVTAAPQTPYHVGD